MNFTEIIEQIKSELDNIEQKEQANQKEQVELTDRIEQLTQQIEQLQQEIAAKNQRQSELDHEAVELCRISEELNQKREQVVKIKTFSEEFQGLQAEFQDNEDLLNTLYSSISAIATSDNQKNIQTENLESTANQINQTQDSQLSIRNIKTQLPNAEKLYQQLVAQHLEQYHTYQNLIVDGLDLIWFSVGFVAFGKESYKRMCLKYHPDLEGSEIAMQLINAAWEISQIYADSLAN